MTNKDECVTVKVRVTTDKMSHAQYLIFVQSPAQNILVESIYCNRSGGCAVGSLGSGTDISNVHYRNIYTWHSNQMMMLKSNGGSGSVSNVLLRIL